MDVYKIRGDENAKSLYEFFVDGTSENAVEWSWFETGIEGDNGLNFISTSHETKTDKSAKELFHKQLGNGYSIRSYTHNHPSGNNNPSVDDISVYRYIYDFNKWNAKYNNIHRTSPQYRIFTDKLHIVPNNLYIK